MGKPGTGERKQDAMNRPAAVGVGQDALGPLQIVAENGNFIGVHPEIAQSI